ncbi:MAG: hypothetical protein EXS13_09385 [Planctomycetes bacterium]|nr:hypothetical protein [Planctomycetota bacterium]
MLHALLASRRTTVLLAAATAFALSVPAARAQLPPPVSPPENPITPEKAVLGKILFWDEQLSSDNTIACGTCHRPEFGGGDLRFIANPGPDGFRPSPDDLFGSPGVIRSDDCNQYEPDPLHGFLPQSTARNSPTNLMGGYHAELFWDGRASTTFVDPQSGNVAIASGGALETQSVGPIVSSIEMAHAARDWDAVTNKLEFSHPLALADQLPADVAAALIGDPTYPDLFNTAFGDSAITSERIAFALATYQRTLVPDQTPWDDFNAGDNGALTQRQKNGLTLFTGKAGCAQCHTTGLFTNDSFRNIGLRDPATDPGREAVTGDHGDRGKMKVPSLRNVGLRLRVMHTGQFVDLNQVVGFYDRGGDFADNRDPLIVPLRLSQRERDELADFVVNGLIDSRVRNETAPFDRPRLRTETNPLNPRIYGRGSRGSGGFEPLVIAVTPPNVGNLDFKFGVFQARGSALAFAILSYSSEPPGTTWKGIPLNIDLDQMAYALALSTFGAGPGAGYATFGGELPDDPTLLGLGFYGQWFVTDPAATGGFASSAGVEFTIF